LAQFNSQTAIVRPSFIYIYIYIYKTLRFTSKEALCSGSKIWTVHKRDALIHTASGTNAILKPLLGVTILARTTNFDISNILKVENILEDLNVIKRNGKII
jgi:hypothetical protein